MSYISLEANISVGKSTLLPKIAELLNMNPIPEDLTKDGEFLKALAEFNEDPDKAIDLQLTINEYRVRVATGTFIGEHLVERSMMSDMIFAKVMNDRGDISNGDYKLFMALAEVKISVLPPEMVVYLYCDPVVAYRRMKDRNRPEESNNTLEYLMELGYAHDDMLPDLCDKFDIPLLRLDYTHFMDPKDVAHAIKTMRRLSYA